jgi:hypothetical protein
MVRMRLHFAALFVVACGPKPPVGVRTPRAAPVVLPRCSDLKGDQMAISAAGLERAPDETACPETSPLGGIIGRVRDDATGHGLPGATVVATSSALTEPAAVLSGDAGWFAICELPPGDYEITFYYADLTLSWKDIGVTGTHSTPVQARLNTGLPGDESLVIDPKGPTHCMGDFPPAVPADCGIRVIEVEFARASPRAPCIP